MTFPEALQELLNRYDPDSTTILSARRRNGDETVKFHLVDNYGSTKVLFFYGAFSEMDGFYAECEDHPSVDDLQATDWEVL